MRERGFGRIVNIGSINGQAGQYGQVNYAAAKSGIHGFTKALAKEFAGRAVTVNAIAPGFIETDMTNELSEAQQQAILAEIPLKSFGSVDDIAASVMFLAGSGARYITGQVLTVDGGMVM